MSPPLHNLLRLDQLLRSPLRQTDQTLAEALELATRTIRNYRNYLRDTLGAPLAFTKQRGWHYTEADWRLPTVSLSVGEVFALTLGARMLESYSGSAYRRDLETAIAQLQERLPEPMAVSLQQLADERVRFRPGGEVALDPTIWVHLLQACSNSQQVWLRYYSAQRQQESERTVDPYLIDVYRSSNPYLFGFCHERQDWRTFRIDRIRELRVLPQRFERDPSLDLEQYLNDGFQYEFGGEPVAIAIEFDAATAPFIVERRWHSSQVIEPLADGGIVLKLCVTGLNDVKRWVLGYGRGAVVREPPELVAMVREEIGQMYYNYGDPRLA